MIPWISLTPEDDMVSTVEDTQGATYCTWVDDSYCQENLFQIISLMPEETIVDEKNHIKTYIKLFFEELGCLTEEPEPIDPNCDYEAEARQLLLRERNQKNRRKHVDLSKTPSLDGSRSSSLASSTQRDVCHDTKSDYHITNHREYHLTYQCFAKS